MLETLVGATGASAVVVALEVELEHPEVHSQSTDPQAYPLRQQPPPRDDGHEEKPGEQESGTGTPGGTLSVVVVVEVVGADASDTEVLALLELLLVLLSVVLLMALLEEVGEPVVIVAIGSVVVTVCVPE